MTNVAIIGAGSVGRAVAERLLELGEQVSFGVRDPGAAAAKLPDPLAGVPTLVPAEAAVGAELVVLAVPAGVAVKAVSSAGELAGKTLLDCTNPLGWEGGPVWAPPPEGSVAQALAAAFPDLAVVKGLNHFGVEIHRNPALLTGPADAFFAADDSGVKATVMELAERMGFRPRDAGPLRNAGLLENLAVLWIHLANTGSGRLMAFRTEDQA